MVAGFLASVFPKLCLPRYFEMRTDTVARGAAVSKLNRNQDSSGSSVICDPTVEKLVKSRGDVILFREQSLWIIHLPRRSSPFGSLRLRIAGIFIPKHENNVSADLHE